MKISTYLFFLLGFQSAFAQFGIFNLDTLLYRHPHRKVIDYQITKQAKVFDSCLKEMAETFFDHPSSRHRCQNAEGVLKTQNELQQNQKELQQMQEQIKAYQDSAQGILTTMLKSKMDSLRSTIWLDCQWYIRQHPLTFMLVDTGIVYTSKDVKDYTPELLAYLEDRYRFTLANGRLQLKSRLSR